MARTKSTTQDNLLGRNIEALMGISTTVHSQNLLAKKSGLAQSTVGRIVRGEVSPSAENVQKIADALDVSVAVLYSPVMEKIGTFQEARVRATETRFVSRKSGKTPLLFDVISLAEQDSEDGRRVELRKTTWGGTVIGEVDDGYAARIFDEGFKLHGQFLLVEKSGAPFAGDLCFVHLKDGRTFLHVYALEDDEGHVFETPWGQTTSAAHSQVESIHGVVAIASARQWRPK